MISSPLGKSTSIRIVDPLKFSLQASNFPLVCWTWSFFQFLQSVHNALAIGVGRAVGRVSRIPRLWACLIWICAIWRLIRRVSIPTGIRQALGESTRTPTDWTALTSTAEMQRSVVASLAIIFFGNGENSQEEPQEQHRLTPWVQKVNPTTFRQKYLVGVRTNSGAAVRFIAKR
jgi:hypothetical protein